MGIDTTIPIIEQIRWERDTAIEQLSQIDKGLGERMDDVEKVVRCKDCKWYGRADKRRFYRGMDCLNKRIATIDPDMDYCSRAERRTDETD